VISRWTRTYRRKGVAALIAIKGDIEGRVILDLAPDVAMRVASQLAGEALPESEQVIAKPLQLANMSSATASRLSTTRGSASKFFRRKFTSASKAWAAAPTPKPWSSASKPLAAKST